MHKKNRFWLGSLIAICVYAIPIVGLAYAGITWLLALVLAGLVFSIYFVYCITIKSGRLRYPIVNPEGHPDIYSGRMPRPIYEDMRRYPWFFRRKRSKESSDKKDEK